MQKEWRKRRGASLAFGNVAEAPHNTDGDLRMSSLPHEKSRAQVGVEALERFRASLCTGCLRTPPPGRVMQRPRIQALKRLPGVFSVRCRCPREDCRCDFTVRVRVSEGAVEIVHHPEEVVLEYAGGERTSAEIAEDSDFSAASTVWRPVDHVLEAIESWIQTCRSYVADHDPACLDLALIGVREPVDEGRWLRRRFRKADRPRRLALDRTAVLST